MFSLNFFIFSFVFLLIFEVNLNNCQAPYEYDDYSTSRSSPMDDLDPFAQASLENIQLFKTKVFKLIEAQNHYFELIQQKRPAIGDYEYVKFDVLLPGPDYDLPLMDNQRLIAVPKPNVPSNYTQLLLSIDEKSQLNLWQFVSDHSINRITKYRLGQTIITNGIDGNRVQCIKIKSFVVKTGLHRFRLQAVALFSIINNDDSQQQQQQFSSGTDFILVLAINLIIHGSNVVLQTDFIEEQVIKFEKIPDFDLLYLSKNRIYMSLIQNSEDSNFKYELSLYQLINDKLFDKIAWQRSDFILNANRVKLASMDSRLYLICSYDISTSSRFYYDDQSSTTSANFINVFQLIENIQQPMNGAGSKLIFVSSVNNFTATTAKEIHHLSGNNDFFFLVKDDDIDVYWFDGHSLIYYETVLEKRSISFALDKIADQPPLILSTDGQNMNLYYKVYSKFIYHQLDLYFIDQYRLEQVEIFTFNRQYYIWFKFGPFDSIFEDSSKKYFCQFARVQTRKPETNEEMHNLDTCLMDLRDRLDGGLREVKTLKRKSENLLVISAAEPYIDVDVIVHDTFRVERAEPESFSLKVPGKVIKGDSVTIFVESISGRVDHLENRINTTVLLRNANQTISSPIEFLYPVTADYFSINSVDTHFYLNDINFDIYANNSLTWNTEQTIASNFIFLNGLQVDQLLVDRINGIDIKYAMSTNETAATQFVTEATHRYHYLELLNGTTATRINDVNLVDLFQDQPNPIQMIRGQKTFANVSVQEISVDTLFNGLNLGEFLQEIVWLENDKIPFQRLKGEWRFNDESRIQNLTILNLINGKIDFDNFVNNTAKKNAASIIIESPVDFQNQVHVNYNLNVTGLINGLNLHEDVILTRGDQDFTKKYHFQAKPIVFESRTTRFTNLTIEVLNDRFKPKNFLLRKAKVDVDGGDDDSSSKFILRNKYFQNDLIVRGNVHLRPEIRMNQIQVRELFYNLDTMVSFSTPVTVEELIVDGNVHTNQFNDLHAFYVKQRMSNLLLRDIPQTFHIPLSFYGSLEISNLTFDQFTNNLKFPEHFIPRYNQSEDIVFTAMKYFESPVKVEKNIYLGQNGSINGGSIKQVYDTMVKLNSSEVQKIGGRKTFKNLIVHGNVHIRDNKINGYNLNDTINIHSEDEQIVKMPLVIGSIIVDYDDLQIKDMNIERGINGLNYRKFWLDAVSKPNKQYPVIELYNKHFPEGLYVNHILTNGSINGVDLPQLIQNAMTLDTNQNITTSIFFMNATFDKISNFETINGLNRNYFEQVVRKDTPIVHIYPGSNLESILGYWYIKDLNVRNLVNGYNITDIYRRTLKRHSVTQQTITAKHIYLKPLEIINLELPIETVSINQIPIRNYVWLSSPNLIFNSDVIFENLKQIGNLTVHGLINRCYFNDMVTNSIKRNPNDLTFNLTGTYVLPKIIIKGNVKFLSKINEKPNFLDQLVQVNDHRSLQNNVSFFNDITVKKIFINNLINNRNLSMLLHDAVYMHRPQHITGTKTFTKPIKIIGNIEQIQPNPVAQLFIKNRFNDHNLTDLFENTMRTNDRRPIMGKKIFTGNITFGNSVRLGHGLNGLRFPDDYVLTYTNETINGQTNFHKKVRIHRNLNVQLINHINVTQFVHDAIMINETQQRQVLTTVRFKHPIKIRNLTVFQQINDIGVDDLITKKSMDSSPVEIPGVKIFKDDLIINGQLNVRSNMINDVDLVQDIKNQWIDRRNISDDNLSNVTGRLIFNDLIHADSIRIESTLNGVPVKQFSEKLTQMERDIGYYKRELQQSLNETKRNEQIIMENYTKNFMIDLKYFKLHQVIPISMERFMPLYEENLDQFTKILIGQTVQKKSACNLNPSRGFSVDSYGFVREYQMPLIWRNYSMIIDQNDDTLALINWNSVASCGGNENQMSNSYFIQFWHNFEFMSLMNGEGNDDLIQTKNSFPLNLDGVIESMKMFHSSGKKVDYLLIYYRTMNGKKLKLFKHFNEQIVELNSFEILANWSVKSYDLYEMEDLILMSLLLNDGGSSNQTTKLLFWNPKLEIFQLHSSFLTYDPFNFIKMIPMKDHFLILYAQIQENGIHHRCKVGNQLIIDPDSINKINLFELIQPLKNEDFFIQKLYQVITTRLNKIKGIQLLKFNHIKTTTTYLLVFSSSQVELFQYHGYNGFESISLFQMNGNKINEIKDYWLNKNQLFLIISGNNGNSWILSTKISGLLN